MRKWGLVVTLFYLVLVLALIVPATIYFAFFPNIKTATQLYAGLRETYSYWVVWVLVGMVIFGPVLLLWLSVDTTRKRLKPRTHILVSAVTTAMLLALLTSAVVLAVAAVLWGDRLDQWIKTVELLGTLFVPWLVWGILFYRLSHGADDAVTRSISWLLRGSVLELLIVVPSHIIVRRRDDCSAPIMTGYGIATGIAIMLLSFGPSVLLLYRKRIARHSSGQAAT